ncbi:aminotransferase [Streptomyces sp. WAC05374]|uniref:aminotransferase class IV family protein n=1 Tax=Streptomyces sp. WAC05374 TaxID=2487420 RepID=UPI000F897FE5|nr:aminotransferase class IV family protein [Streptomyces sp. WAC05374]RST15223.1 aminotransferase [Streptomyces sp. WAC05374]TDF41098.1 aminotransferase [Streptomyces sp. WAC05374]TDF49743.1 aminotransferase [Streptomyces sp. WAC05374]TDF51368.1 aminotransferase [Streptomyces sp. WAC05374]
MATFEGRPVTADDVLPLALTNLGHFTSMRVDADRTIRGLTLHMERLARDCRAVWGAELDTARVRDLVRAALEGHVTPCVVRVTVHDPGAEVGRRPGGERPGVLVTVRGAGGLPASPLRVRSVMYERDLPHVKHVGLFGALHARRTAQLAGGDDALFTGRDGLVSEGATWNAGFVDHDGTVVWPRAPVLPGVTMALLQRHAPGAAHRTVPLTLDRAKGMAAAFATNTAIGVRPLGAIDGTDFPAGHPVLSALRETYLSIPGETV